MSFIEYNKGFLIYFYQNKCIILIFNNIIRIIDLLQYTTRISIHNTQLIFSSNNNRFKINHKVMFNSAMQESQIQKSQQRPSYKEHSSMNQKLYNQQNQMKKIKLPNLMSCFFVLRWLK
ncbi:hypothetical protein FGO68_gene16933 [Halteria grandinella]|uniref:Uncharacterized protein n=1 Tax=Halteria grandinella TaxID=5974 RepID=A0A8J8NFR4_HALGN|nr:hypothetical protein FGO68_gene16933 [Halteria grandinella]